MNMFLALTSVLPRRYPTYYWTPLLVLIGWLALLGLLAFIVLTVYLLLRPRGAKGEGGSEVKPVDGQDRLLRDLGIFVLYAVVFFGSWIMVGSIVWLLGAFYLSLVMKGQYSLWHFLLPYFLIILTLPLNSLVCLKTWGAIKTRQGDEKKVLIGRKKIFLFVQLFFSAVFFVLFSGLTALVSVLFLVYSSGYVDAEELAILGLPVIPMTLSFLAGLWYLVELMLLRKEE